MTPPILAARSATLVEDYGATFGIWRRYLRSESGQGSVATISTPGCVLLFLPKHYRIRQHLEFALRNSPASDWLIARIKAGEVGCAHLHRLAACECGREGNRKRDGTRIRCLPGDEGGLWRINRAGSNGALTVRCSSRAAAAFALMAEGRSRAVFGEGSGTVALSGRGRTKARGVPIAILQGFRCNIPGNISVISPPRGRRPFRSAI